MYCVWAQPVASCEGRWDQMQADDEADQDRYFCQENEKRAFQYRLDEWDDRATVTHDLDVVYLPHETFTVTHELDIDGRAYFYIDVDAITTGSESDYTTPITAVVKIVEGDDDGAPSEEADATTELFSGERAKRASLAEDEDEDEDECTNHKLNKKLFSIFDSLASPLLHQKCAQSRMNSLGAVSMTLTDTSVSVDIANNLIYVYLFDYNFAIDTFYINSLVRATDNVIELTDNSVDGITFHHFGPMEVGSEGTESIECGGEDDCYWDNDKWGVQPSMSELDCVHDDWEGRSFCMLKKESKECTEWRTDQHSTSDPEGEGAEDWFCMSGQSNKVIWDSWEPEEAKIDHTVHLGVEFATISYELFDIMDEDETKKLLNVEIVMEDSWFKQVS